MKKIRRILALILLLAVAVTGAAAAGQGFTEDADAIERAADSVFMLEVYSRSNQKIGVGSGFVAFDSGTLVTNYHVIDGGAYLIAVSDDNARYYVDRVCMADSAEDIAILRFEEEGVARPLELDTSGNLKRAQPVVAIGSPAGLMNTVSIGNISAFYRQGGKDWIQFTAPISSGSSGGALLNDEGKVIGITTATYASTQNINVAVKATAVQRLYDAWDGRTLRSMGGRKGNAVTPTAGQQGKKDGQTVTVYVGRSGKKYHNTPTCSGMQNAVEMDLLEAIGRGYEPCGKCYK